MQLNQVFMTMKSTEAKRILMNTGTFLRKEQGNGETSCPGDEILGMGDVVKSYIHVYENCIYPCR